MVDGKGVKNGRFATIKSRFRFLCEIFTIKQAAIDSDRSRYSLFFVQFFLLLNILTDFCMENKGTLCTIPPPHPLARTKLVGYLTKCHSQGGYYTMAAANCFLYRLLERPLKIFLG